MTSPRSTLVPNTVLREAARARVASTSRRAFAAEVGISYGAVTKFLAGSEPYAGNLKKLTEWYIRSAPVVDAEAVEHALALLLRSVPEELQAEAAAEVRSVLEKYLALINRQD